MTSVPGDSDEPTTDPEVSSRIDQISGRGDHCYNDRSQIISIPGEARLACPYFMPVEKLEGGSWPHPARLPLGCGWSGHCTAPGHENSIPAREILERLCNLGYAGACEWAPRQRPWDAVRFSVVARAADDSPSGAASNERAPSPVIQLAYVCERNHQPCDHGRLGFNLRTSAWERTHPDARVQKMAQCFLESYLQKKS